SGFEVDMLRQQTELQRARTCDLAAISRFVAGHQTKDRRLAGSVAAHKANVLARINLQRSATQDVLRAVGFENVCESKQHDRTHEAGASSNSLSLHPLCFAD